MTHTGMHGGRCACGQGRGKAPPGTGPPVGNNVQWLSHLGASSPSQPDAEQLPDREERGCSSRSAQRRPQSPPAAWRRRRREAGLLQPSGKSTFRFNESESADNQVFSIATAPHTAFLAAASSQQPAGISWLKLFPHAGHGGAATDARGTGALRGPPHSDETQEGKSTKRHGALRKRVGVCVKPASPPAGRPPEKRPAPGPSGHTPRSSVFTVRLPAPPRPATRAPRRTVWTPAVAHGLCRPAGGSERPASAG